MTRDILRLIRPLLPLKGVSTYVHSTNVEDNRNAPENDRLREQLAWGGRHVPHFDNGAQQMDNPAMSTVARLKQDSFRLYAMSRLHRRLLVLKIEPYRPCHCEP